MLQPIFTLADQFPADRFTIQIETAGTVWPDDVLSPGNFRNMQIICSPKTPKIHDAIPQWVSAWKYIVDAEDPGWIDGLPMTSTQLPGRSVRIYRPKPGHPAPIYVQPRDDYDPDKNQANLRHAAKIAMEQGYRLSVQVHKLVGLP
jgi:organic radical activating enzyme